MNSKYYYLQNGSEHGTIVTTQNMSDQIINKFVIIERFNINVRFVSAMVLRVMRRI